MKLKLIHKYCDLVLKEMNKQEDEVWFKFATGPYKNTELPSGQDLFTKTNIPDSYSKIVLDTLSDAKLIHWRLLKSDIYQDKNWKLIDNGGRIYKISLIRDGKIFINSTSFRKEDRNEWLQRWFNQWVAAVSALVAVISVVIAGVSLN